MPDDFTPIFSTREAADRFDKARLRGLAQQARDNRADLHRSYLDLATALFNLKCDGVDPAFLDEVARGGHDAISNRDAAFTRDIDAAGEMFDPLDLTQLEEFFIAREAA